MKLLPIVVGLFASAYGQYGPIVEETTTAASFPNFCENLEDGNYGDGCTEDFYSCVAGVAYNYKCNDKLLFDVAKNMCVYPEECGVEATTAKDVPSTTTRKTTTARTSDIDCSGMEDGFYSSGCTEYYTICSYGVATVMDCAEGTLFDTVTGHCEHAHQCGHAVTQPVTYPTAAPVSTDYPTTAASTSAPTTTNANDSPFNCLEKEDGTYSLGCQNEFVQCVSGVSMVMKCPAGLVFDEGVNRCEHTCGQEATTTVAYDSTTFASSTTPFYTTAGTTTPVYTTASIAPSTTAEPVTEDTTTTPVPTTTGASCQSGQVSSMGACSSKFQRCRCGQWVSAVCPGTSLFDEVTNLCLYSLPRCQSGVNPGQPQYPSTDSGYITPGQGYNTAPAYVPVGHAAYVPWESEQLLSNPFFTAKRHRSSHKKESRDKTRKMKGKLRAESKSIRVDDRSVYIKDAFRGPYEPYVHSSSWNVFPRSRVHRMRMHQAMNEQSDEDETTPVEEPVTTEKPTTTIPPTGLPFARAAPAFNIPEDTEVEGSGSEDMLMPEEDATTRKKRSYGFPATNNGHNYCRGVATNTLISTGRCLQDFIFCRSYVAVFAGCPLGDLFDGDKQVCVPASICGVPGSDVCASVVTPVVETTTQAVVTPSVPVASESPVAGSCVNGFSGIIASDCSKDYIVCDNGVELSMSCPDALIYDKVAAICNYPGSIIGCGGSPDATTTPAATAAPIATTAVPYVPIASTPAASSGSCSASSNGFVPAGACSKQFLLCHDGELQATMDCPAELVFNTKGYCDYPANVAECGAGSTVTSSTPAAEAQSEATLPPYALVDPTTQAPSTFAPQTTTTEAVVDVVTTSENLCGVPVSSKEVCSPKYEVCSNGIYFEMTCASGLVFNNKVGSCDFKELVKECPEYIMEESATEAIATSTTAAASTVTTPAQPSTAAVEPSTTPLAYGQPQCEYAPGMTGIATGYCSRTYLKCTPEGVFENAECQIGYLFEVSSSVCVVAQQCGQAKTTTTTVAPDTRCSALPNGEGFTAVDKCSNQYLSCKDFVAVSMNCPDNLVYSRGQCVRRHTLRECANNNIVYVSLSANRSEFCAGREDRLYRDPQNCQAIIQCHGGEMFTPQGCSSGLVFNEQHQRCDYRQNVQGCEEKQQDPQQDLGCKGREHGAYLADPSDCSIFWRCVWNRLERMSCPSGTLFNPALSVCDWPAAIPQCLAGNSPTEAPEVIPAPY